MALPEGGSGALDVAELARLVARADALHGLVRAGLTEESLPVAAALRDALRGALEAAQGAGAEVVRLGDRARRK